MIPTYNCAIYLRQTLTSVLAQDPGANTMQIEVVDDCSTLDDPAKVVEAVAANPFADVATDDSGLDTDPDWQPLG